MKRRKTKAQREAEQHRALWQRVYDVFCGACGRAFDEAYDSDPGEWLTLEEASLVIPALRELFEGDCTPEQPKPPYRYLFTVHCISNFDSVQSVVSYLWEAGVRE